MTGATHGLRLLLVEDGELDAEVLLNELVADGLKVEFQRVESEPAFVRALQTFAPDLIVSDLSMPEFSGYRALELACAQAPDLPFLFVSGTIGEDAAVAALRGGAVDYLLKHDLVRLSSAVRRALAEAKNRRARALVEAELAHTQHYEGVALLASGLSHDLRNVLQPISMSASLLREDPSEEIRKIGQLIDECTQRGLDIVASMLSFAKGPHAATHRVSMRSLLDGLIVLLRGSLDRNIVLHVPPADASLEIEGSHNELQQCLLNLCLNGVQAMPEGGELRVEAEQITLDDSFFEEDETRLPGNYLQISISDSGVGMSAEVRNRLFTPFFTTKEKGTGLGLLSCRHILDNHGGFLRLVSTVGRGTTFSLYLPMRTAAKPTSRLAHGERVLIVIENERERRSLFHVIASRGYAVSSAANGSEALRLLDSKSLPDVVVMESPMNLMTGVATASKLVEMKYQGLLILISGNERATIEHDLPPLPVIRFVDKPVDIEQLLVVMGEEVDVARTNIIQGPKVSDG